jgi:Contractile injection system tape measure protein
MLQQSSHIIQQQNIEIQFDDISYGLGVQNDIADLFYEELLPKMELLFDELTAEKYSVTADKLEIDCGVLSSQYWKDELVQETLYRLRQQLIMAHKKEITGKEITQKVDQGTFDHLLFFIKKGYLPWNSRIHSIVELEEMASEKLIAEKPFIDKLKDLFKNEPWTAERFSNNFSESLLRKIIELIAGNKNSELEKIYHSLNEQKTIFRQKVIYASLLKILSTDDPSIEKELPSLLNENVLKEKIQEQKKKAERKKKDEDAPDAIYIENAGLIILHPFLPELFTRIELLVDKKWKDVYSQHTAATVLQYLVTGKEEFEEFNFPLNKILCGMSVDEVLQPAEELAEHARSECDELLKDVIRHWSILKNTSVEGLRETFLHRNGKLAKVENGWLLNVERKGVDILLSSLPWGIGTIKLPWTDGKLFVEWIT